MIPHDASEPVGFVVEDPCGRRVGLVADVGCRTSLAWGRLRDLDVLIIETNHDLDMLRNGPYPWALKQRVAGRHGHLSNREAAEGLPELVGDRLRWVVLYHLSRTNNLPALAAAAIGETLDREGCPAQMAVTEQDRPTPWLEVTELRRKYVKARVTVYPRREILDPQGKAIRDALSRVGFPGVDDVRAGKSFEISLGLRGPRGGRAGSSATCARSCSPTPWSRTTRSSSSTARTGVRP